jgi:hypothetical protein
VPKALEDKLRRQGVAKGYSGDRLNHYIFGTMNSIGAVRGNKETAKGAEIQKELTAGHAAAALARRKKRG